MIKFKILDGVVLLRLASGNRLSAESNAIDCQGRPIEFKNLITIMIVSSSKRSVRFPSQRTSRPSIAKADNYNINNLMT